MRCNRDIKRLLSLDLPRLFPFPCRTVSIDWTLRLPLALAVADSVAFLCTLRLVACPLHDLVARRPSILGIGDECATQIVENQAAIFSAPPSPFLKLAKAEFRAAIVPDMPEVSNLSPAPAANERGPRAL